MTETTFAVQYLRPDGWWEAGRGWDDREHAEKDGREQIPAHRSIRVVEVPVDSEPAEAVE